MSFNHKLILGILVVVAGLGISLSASGLACTLDSDCAAGYVCRSNVCSLETKPQISVKVVQTGSVCGNGVAESGESCDDGNTVSGDGCSASCQTEAASGTQGFVRTEEPATVVLQGKTYPQAFLKILKNTVAAATLKAENDGTFTVPLTGLSPGTYTFSLQAEDTEGRKSVTLNFTITVVGKTITTISGIFFPPTIEVVPAAVERGGRVEVRGQAVPGSIISVFVSPGDMVMRTSALENGKWELDLNTLLLREGTYFVKAKAQSATGEQSQFSDTKILNIGKPLERELCPHGDLNGDGQVNMIDLSILLFWWEKYHTCPDQNQDGIVDMIDVSIMLFWWTD